MGGPGAGRRSAVKILVTGASGMLGAATAHALAERGDTVTVLQRRTAGLGPGVNQVLADVADAAAVRTARDLERAETLLRAGILPALF